MQYHIIVDLITMALNSTELMGFFYKNKAQKFPLSQIDKINLTGAETVISWACLVMPW